MALQSGGSESHTDNNVSPSQINLWIRSSLRQNHIEIAQSPDKDTSTIFKPASIYSSVLTKNVKKIPNARSNKQLIFCPQRIRFYSANMNKEGTNVKIVVRWKDDFRYETMKLENATIFSGASRKKSAVIYKWRGLIFNLFSSQGRD